MNIISQVDFDGHNSKTLDGIVDYKQDDSAVSKSNAFITNNRVFGKLRQEKTGWNFLIDWKDVTITWKPLKILKDSNPIELAKFVVSRVISGHPHFHGEFHSLSRIEIELFLSSTQ